MEPSCLLTLRDEYLVLGLHQKEVGVLAERAALFEEFLADELTAGRLDLPLKPIEHKRALLHGHCHQKAFTVMPAVVRVLSLVPELAVQPVESGCCGMAGVFGYQAKHFDIATAMGEAGLFQAVRAQAPETLIVADGTSCRQQIQQGTGRLPLHAARVLELALSGRS
jgi:Fe-S oxidoreductase